MTSILLDIPSLRNSWIFIRHWLLDMHILLPISPLISANSNCLLCYLQNLIAFLLILHLKSIFELIRHDSWRHRPFLQTKNQINCIGPGMRLLLSLSLRSRLPQVLFGSGLGAGKPMKMVSADWTRVGKYLLNGDTEDARISSG